MEKIKAKVENVLHPHKDTTHTGTTHTGTTHTGGVGHSDPTGPHDSRLGNKADPRVDSDRPGGLGNTTGAGGPGHTHGTTHNTHGLTGNTHTGTNTLGGGPGPAPHTAGPHSSDMMNKADPRVDSDMDRSRGVGGTGGLGHTTGTTGGLGHTSGTTGGLGHTSGPGPAAHTAGPHSSDMMNKADPRVDSDMDRTRGVGGTGGLGHTTGTTGGLGHTSGTGGLGHTSGPGPAAHTAGPHSSDMMNKADPRVDSDMDRTRGVGHTTGTTGTTGGLGHTSGTGGLGHTGNTHTGTSTLGGGPGPAPNTAGPHKSDMMNKVDPRVDSDLDGSKTVGGNSTMR